MLIPLAVVWSICQPPLGGKPASLPDGGVVVEVDGIGRSDEDALKDAYNQAVRKVVGVLVDAETFVRNDRVISDQIISYSDGLVTKCERLGRSVVGNLVRVRVRAVVERSGTVLLLRAAKVRVIEVDGGSLHARVVTQQEAVRAGRQMFARMLAGFPLNCLELVALGQPEAERSDGSDEVTLRLSVRYRVDERAFGVFTSKLIRLLDSLPYPRSSFKLSPITVGQFSNVGRPRAFVPNWHIPMPKWFGPSGYRGPADGLVLAVHTDRSASGTDHWKTYELDAEARLLLAGIDACVWGSHVALVDATGQPVAEERRTAALTVGLGQFRVTPVHAATVDKDTGDDPVWSFGREPDPGVYAAHYRRTAERERLVLLAPYFFDERMATDGRVYVSHIDREVALRLPVEAVRRVSRVRCNLVFAGQLPPTPELLAKDRRGTPVEGFELRSDKERP